LSFIVDPKEPVRGWQPACRDLEAGTAIALAELGLEGVMRMNAIDLLVQQHRALEARMNDWLLADGVSKRMRGAAFGRVADELAMHVESEEQVFYPAVREKNNEDILLESLEEHLSLKRLVADLNGLEADDPTFEAKFKVLAEQTEHHHEEEEEHLFPKVRKMFDPAQLETLGQRMLALQQRLASAGDPREVLDEQTEQAAPLPPAAGHYAPRP
jgi:hemerythrin superfamily protein